MSIITLNHVELLFNDQLVLDDICLTITPGETTVIMGPSGCGKSSLLKVIAGIIPPNNGEVLFYGEDINKMKEQQYQEMQFQTGFIFQDGALWNNKSLYENLTFPLLVSNPKLRRVELDLMVQQCIKTLNFNQDLLLRPAALSSGEIKILSFLRAVIGDPPIIFMDEPTTFVDRRAVGKIKDRIRFFKEQKKTMVAITHERSFAKELADRFIFLKEGKILADGSPTELLQSESKKIKEFANDLFE
ncbi:MAG: ATP-binding cassette domain-containing protein [Spirochaetaceae bacterium]|jgi:ABC-type transporter Mla maintaining outer membrane lipid asymmetry ATPase subunit MlaF|nr:ATP-binding cassette domain-containing protein [Spirochaetaceae bacterium]